MHGATIKTLKRNLGVRRSQSGHWIGEKFLLSPPFKRQVHSHLASTTYVIHYTLREMEVIVLDTSSVLLVTEPTVVSVSVEVKYNSAELFPHIQSSVTFLALVKFDCYILVQNIRENTKQPKNFRGVFLASFYLFCPLFSFVHRCSCYPISYLLHVAVSFSGHKPFLSP